VRITVQLIDARSDTHLWSDTYDRTLEDIFAVQDEIAASVLEQLQIVLLGVTPHRDEIDPEAYALLLRARHILNERLQDSYPVADLALKEALAIEPGYADAMIELGRLRHSEGVRGLRTLEEGIRLARELMWEVLEADPENGYAYGWLGFLTRRYEDDIVAAARYTERAMALDPTNTELLGAVIGIVKALGHLEESIMIGEYVVSHDPLCDDCYYGLASSYRDAMRLDEAEATLRTGLALRPGRPVYRDLGLVLLLKGEAEAALAEFQQIDENDPDRFTYTALALYDLGRRAESEAAFSELRERFGEPLSIAQVYAYLGDVEAAFEWLDRVFEDQTRRDPVSYGYRPTFRNLHADPRWQDFLRRMGIAPEQLAALDFKVTLPE
jgi:tetratricopeptide (TPR) repeat protein